MNRLQTIMAKKLCPILGIILLSACAASAKFNALKTGDKIAILASESGNRDNKPAIKNRAIGTDASTGAGSGALAGAAIGLSCGPLAIACSPVAALAGAITGGAAGALVGSTKGLSKEQIKAVDDQFIAFLQSHDPDEELVQTTRLRVARKWEVIAPPADKEARLSIRSLLLKTNGKSQMMLELVVIVTVETGKLTNNSKVKTRKFLYSAPPTFIDSWLANENNFIQERFDEAYNTLAENIAVALSIN